MARVQAVSSRATEGQVDLTKEVKKVAEKAAASQSGFVEAEKRYEKIYDSAMGKTEYRCYTTYRDKNDKERAYTKGRIVCVLKGAKTQYGNLEHVPKEYR